MNDKEATLLIVEDDPVSRKLLTFMLSKMNFDYLEAETGELALELMQENTVSGMLVDIALGPGISGVTLMEKFRDMGRFKHITIIAVTAYENRVIGKIGPQGFTDYLGKPYRYDQLKDMLQKHGLIR